MMKLAALIYLAMATMSASEVRSTMPSALLNMENSLQTHVIRVSVADTPLTRQIGLMAYDKTLEEQSGVWFDFQATQPVAMWMKDTPKPLDMIFVAEDGRVVGWYDNAHPNDETAIHSPEPVRYVLEMKAGERQRLSVSKQTRIVVMKKGKEAL